MRFVLFLIFVIVVLLLLLALVVAIGALWNRRGARRAAEQFGDAGSIVRRWGGNPRPTRRLARLANDARTPAPARTHLDRLVRYREHPIVLAPDWVPVLGWLDEVTIESFLLRQAWRTLPPEVWVEYFPGTRPSGARQPGEPAAPTTANAASRPERLADQLSQFDRAGRHPELLRLLDRRMPSWPVGASVIEVARELIELEQNVRTAHTSGVPEAVTSRLTEEACSAAGALWDLADRVAATAAFGIESERLADHLERENAKLTDLREAIREARTGLAELTLAGVGSSGEVDRAERRFRALARTAEDLQDLNRS